MYAFSVIMNVTGYQKTLIIPQSLNCCCQVNDQWFNLNENCRQILLPLSESGLLLVYLPTVPYCEGSFSLACAFFYAVCVCVC